MLIKRKKTLGEVLTKDVKTLQKVNEQSGDKVDKLERRVSTLEKYIKTLNQCNKRLQRDLNMLRRDTEQANIGLHSLERKIKT